jgi:hypothetical protein
MQKETYIKPDAKTEILDPQVLCNNVGSGDFLVQGGGPNMFFGLSGGGGGGGGLAGCGGSFGVGPSVGDGGFGVK